MSDNNRFPEIIVFAGPNGSGKTTVTKLAKVIEPYINADDIKRTVHCSDLDAAVMAESAAACKRTGIFYTLHIRADF